MNEKQVYRMRAAASGRGALAPAEPDSVYVDRETGEEMSPVAKVLPLAPSDSSLSRTAENLRPARRCAQLIGLDGSDCPHCGLATARTARWVKRPSRAGPVGSLLPLPRRR